MKQIYKFVDFKNRKISGVITYQSLNQIDFEILAYILEEMMLLDNLKNLV